MGRKLAFCLILFYLAVACPAQSPPISNLSSVMVSDGIQAVEKPTFILLNSLISSDTWCKILSNGSAILLQILGPGIIGGLLLPVLGSAPDAAIILASGLTGNKETAQSQVSVGMGLMAGSTVMLLTILWGSCLIVGKLFDAIDENSDRKLSATELRALIIGIQFEEIDINNDDAVRQLMEEFDTSRDLHIDVEEFITGISRWLYKVKRSATSHVSLRDAIVDEMQKTIPEFDLLGHQSDDVVESIKNPKWLTSKAVLMLLMGTVIASVCSDPLVDAVDNFSTASGVPSFFVSFILLLFVTSSEVVSTLTFASRKSLKTASLTYSRIYGSVTMSNILSVSVFLGLVYFRQLTWKFSAEVLVILLVCIPTGLIVSFRTTFPLWMCVVAYALYPFSLLWCMFLDGPSPLQFIRSRELQ
ncbi:hypothetical protein Pint_02380 [Pistacia integerrima]|uniref:Uncharacterized protein n=1 Tax=Pistacia integerrima TaxID=434235 RepID=A0ACC0ZN39_9ROSI|nr:hypothetical protein Pint_02380 [Pistacia integerrima]